MRQPEQRDSFGRSVWKDSETRMPIPFEQYVRGAEFPTTRDELVTRAKENNAPEGVILAIASLPQEWFDSLQDVLDAADGMSGGR